VNVDLLLWIAALVCWLAATARLATRLDLVALGLVFAGLTFIV
jgi:hypothetical protein